MSDKLTGKQKAFCDEYLVDFNATRAYKKVYKCKTDNAAAVNANKLLRNTKVKSYIQAKAEQKEKRTEITQDMVIAEISKLAFAEDNISNKDKIKALELLGRHLSLFTDKLQLEGSLETNITITVGEDDA